MPRLLPLLLLIACGAPEPSDSGTDPTLVSPPKATASQAPAPTVWTVQWTPTPGTHHVEFGLEGGLTHRTPPGDPSAGIALLGLKVDRSYTWQAVTVADDGTELRSDPGSFTTDPAPADLLVPRLGLTTPDTVLASRYVQFSMLQPPVQSWVLVVDGDGDIVWWRRGTQGKLIVTSRMSTSAEDLLYAELPLFENPEETQLIRAPLDGGPDGLTRLYNGHHDFDERPDGSIAFLQYEVGTDAVGDAVIEVPEGAVDGSQARRLYSWLDDYPQAPWYVCEHTLGWAFDASLDDWTHSNSLVPHPDGQHDLVMSKFHDAVLKIHRVSGALVWQLGGEFGDITLPDGSPSWTGLGETPFFSHAHFSHAYPAPAGSGFDLCLAVFDNGFHRTPERSSLVEVCVDESAKTADATWRHIDPDDGFSPLMGDLRRLDDSWLAAWSDLSRVEELADDGTVRWRLDLHPDASSGRVQQVQGAPWPSPL